jgi:hypothetical protein
MSATITTPVSGLGLLEAVGFNRHVAAAIIATRDDWKEILDSIPVAHQRRNVAHVVWGIREALGLEADHAIEICQGVE